jgi:hypothetical protein
MTRSIIYTVDAGGTLTAMRPSEPRSEDFMQQLVASHPELISDRDGALLLIRREQPIADSEDGGGRWSLDHLFGSRSSSRNSTTQLRWKAPQSFGFAISIESRCPTGTPVDAKLCLRPVFEGDVAMASA